MLRGVSTVGVDESKIVPDLLDSVFFRVNVGFCVETIDAFFTFFVGVADIVELLLFERIKEKE